MVLQGLVRIEIVRRQPVPARPAPLAAALHVAAATAAPLRIVAGPAAEVGLRLVALVEVTALEVALVAALRVVAGPLARSEFCWLPALFSSS